MGYVTNRKPPGHFTRGHRQPRGYWLPWGEQGGGPVVLSSVMGDTAPVSWADTDSAQVTLGVVFRSTQAGYLHGLRFYKDARMTGYRLGGLWTAAGVSMTLPVTFDETASGWQETLFTTPKAIAANTNYVAGLFCSEGKYSYTPGLLANAVSSPPLSFPATADVPLGNGRFIYGDGMLFPNMTFGGAYYGVDVLYSRRG